MLQQAVGVVAVPPNPGGLMPGPHCSPPHQLHHLVSDDVCLKVVELYLNEKKRGAAGGNLSSRCVRAARETSYQWKAERCMADENCFKVRQHSVPGPTQLGAGGRWAHDRTGQSLCRCPVWTMAQPQAGLGPCTPFTRLLDAGLSLRCCRA